MLNVILAAPQRHHALTVFPLVGTDAPALPYTPLVDAMESGALVITEVGDGTVPEVRAENASGTAILVLDGEQLVGGRQDRVTTRSTLLPAASRQRLTVTCSERGRWRFVRHDFAPTPRHAPPAVRRLTRETEAEYAALDIATPLEALSHAQYAVWDAIAELARRVGAAPDTGALDDLYTARSDDLVRWSRHFPAVDGQVGLLAFLGERPLGMDLVGDRTLYRRLHDRLVRGYVMDALGSRAEDEPAPGRAQEFLERVRTAPRVGSPTTGQGRYAVLCGGVVGGELRDRAGLVHLSAFPGRLPGDGQE